MLGALSDERTGLPFTIAAGPRHRIHSQVLSGIRTRLHEGSKMNQSQSLTESESLYNWRLTANQFVLASLGRCSSLVD
jgi:hypothetical protein